MATNTAIVPSNLPAELVTAGKIDAEQFLTSVGENAADYTFTPEAPAHYWVPAPNTVIVGTVEGTFVFEKTKTGKPMTSYVIRLAVPAVGHNNETDEDEELEPGDLLSVADRAAMKDLANNIGKKVVIICDGKIQLKNSDKTFWKCRVGIAK
jgi:hypothetical protein